MNLFYDDFKINKPLRLIELFAGYGSQAMGFDRIGAKYEHWFVCEFDKYAIKSYNAVHGTNYEPTDIRNITGKDLKITETDKYCYFMTYSFPCTDISNAGKMEAVKDGLKKSSQTRSGLLWEVERLLEECEELPQILFMENVPGTVNLEGFDDWCRYLEKKGYMNFCQILNAKDYGVPQNRERAFMFSFLGECDYVFPEPQKLEKRLKDVLEDNVDEKYYINNEKAKKLINDLLGTEQNRTEQLTLHLTEVQHLKSVQQLQADMMQESVNIKKKELAYLNSKRVDKVGCEVAKTLCARDYKGFGTGFDTMNGVIEKQ